MSPSYIVEKADHAEVWTNQSGKNMQAWNLLLLDGEKGSIAASANSMQGGRDFVQGETVEGEIRPDNRGGVRFKRAFQGPPSSGGGRSPLESKRIVHQHAQKVAVSFLGIMAHQGMLPKNPDESTKLAVQDIFPLARLIREDVESVQ